MEIQDIPRHFRFLQAGLSIKYIEDELVALGFGAFKALQVRLLMFATQEEGQEVEPSLCWAPKGWLSRSELRTHSVTR